MNFRAKLLSIWMILLPVAVAGCRSTGASTPTFAARGDAPQAVASGMRHASEHAEPTDVQPDVGSESAAVTGVQPASGRVEHTRESAFSRLIGRLGKPKPIPLPRTDLDQPAEDAADTSAGDLANAF